VWGAKILITQAGFADLQAKRNIRHPHAGLPCNKHLVPGDPRPLEIASGVRFGTSAVTTRGLRRKEVAALATWIVELLEGLAADNDNAVIERVIHQKVTELARAFPIYATT
jgi:glycine hydroxymethyltransferase